MVLWFLLIIERFNKFGGKKCEGETESKKYICSSRVNCGKKGVYIIYNLLYTLTVKKK
jgi:hypothetical protein